MGLHLGSSTTAVARPRLLSSFSGVVGDGTTDDTTAIHAALDSGTPVVVDPGKTFVASTLGMPNQGSLTGLGDASILKQKASTTGDFIKLAAATNRRIHLADLRIDGNKANQSTSNAGINLDNTGIVYDSVYGFDAQHTLENLYVQDTKGAGVIIGTNARESRISKVRVFRPDGVGFDLIGSDLFIDGCTVDNAGSYGFKVTTAWASRMTGCKAFYCGRLDQGSGFYFSSVKHFQLAACESQDNQGHGFHFLNSDLITGAALQADSNGFNGTTGPSGVANASGYYLDGSNRCNIMGTAKERRSAGFVEGTASASITGGSQFYVVGFAGTRARNIIRVTAQSLDVTAAFQAPQFGNQASTEDLMLLFDYSGSGGSVVRHPGAQEIYQDSFVAKLGSGGGFKLGSASTEKLAFLGAAPIARQTITGSRGGNAALASLLTQLAAFGLITDSTTA